MFQIIGVVEKCEEDELTYLITPTCAVLTCHDWLIITINDYVPRYSGIAL